MKIVKWITDRICWWCLIGIAIDSVSWALGELNELNK